ncbi:MAG TPA: radical SAM protein [Candidatus Bathyarchaeia archaeon]|nr:radical SAM protein [Candidatus Bathyarchaeia archaeon]
MEGRDGVFDFLENRIITHYPAARMILEGRMPAPRTAIVYPTYVCNQNCLWCEYADDNANLCNIMSGADLRKLIFDLRELGVRGVEFCGGGEPTLHPALPALIREMKSAGVGVGLLTNGTRLKGELAEALADCASYVRIGFDSANEDTFNRVKRPKAADASFGSVCENVRGMIALRNERGGRVLISMKVMLSSDNYTEVEGCVELARELGVDSIQFKAARVCETELQPHEAEFVRGELARLRALYAQLPIVGGVAKLNMTRQCWLTPIQVMVDTLGDVFLCCYYRHRRATHTFGNAFQQPLRDIWYSERHWEAIRAIKPTECNLLDCRFVHYNRIMSELMVNNDAQFDFI